MTALARAIAVSGEPAAPPTLACDTPASPFFQKTGHACRHCGSRVLRSGDTYCCSSCDAVAIHAPDGICGCGMLTGPRAGSALFRCGQNPAKSPASPAEVVILFGERSITK